MKIPIRPLKENIVKKFNQFEDLEETEEVDQQWVKFKVVVIEAVVEKMLKAERNA